MLNDIRHMHACILIVGALLQLNTLNAQERIEPNKANVFNLFREHIEQIKVQYTADYSTEEFLYSQIEKDRRLLRGLLAATASLSFEDSCSLLDHMIPNLLQDENFHNLGMAHLLLSHGKSFVDIPEPNLAAQNEVKALYDYLLSGKLALQHQLVSSVKTLGKSYKEAGSKFESIENSRFFMIDAARFGLPTELPEFSISRLAAENYSTSFDHSISEDDHLGRFLTLAGKYSFLTKQGRSVEAKAFFDEAISSLDRYASSQDWFIISYVRHTIKLRCLYWLGVIEAQRNSNDLQSIVTAMQGISEGPSNKVLLDAILAEIYASAGDKKLSMEFAHKSLNELDEQVLSAQLESSVLSSIGNSAVILGDEAMLTQVTDRLLAMDSIPTQELSDLWEHVGRYWPASDKSISDFETQLKKQPQNVQLRMIVGYMIGSNHHILEQTKVEVETP